MRLLFNYLSMKDSDPVVRSNKKANLKGTQTNGDNNNTKITKFFSSFYSASSNNGTPRKSDPDPGEKIVRKRGRPRKNDINRTIAADSRLKKSKSTSQASTSSSTASNSSSISSTADVKPIVRKRGRPRLQTTKRKGNSKTSPKLRPRRRASQTYFFKYQLARNPLKAEEEDLKLALLASLQQCGGKPGKQRAQSASQKEPVENSITNNKQPKKENHITNHQPAKQQKQKHLPPKHPQHIQETVNLQQTTLPIYDEEYLKRYRPDTEDFLTFICFRVTAPNYPSSTKQSESTEPIEPTAGGSIEDQSSADRSNSEDSPVNGCTTSTGIHVKISNDKTSIDYQNLRRSTSPCKSSASNHTASNSSPNHLNSPSNRRRPTRQSPRLASTSSKKISELDSSNSNTAYDNQITYEEDMKRAQMALDDMAQEINGSDDNNELAQTGHRHNHQQNLSSRSTADGCSGAGCISPSGKLLSPYKNNKHLVKGLMTREFAGAFADEEIIFESINHKL